MRPHGAGWGTELAEQLRLNSAELGIQLVIWDRRIWSGSRPDAGWRAYRGASPHVDHLHVELCWPAARDRPLTVQHINSVLGAGSGGGGDGVRLLRLQTPNQEGDDVRRVQRVLTAWYGLPPGFADGVYGPATAEQVRRAQRATPPQPELADDGIVGPDTLRKLGLA